MCGFPHRGCFPTHRERSAPGMPSPGSSRGAVLGLSLFWLAGISVSSSGSPSSSGSILTARGRAKGCQPLPETPAPLLTAVTASPGTSHQGNVMLPQPRV